LSQDKAFKTLEGLGFTEQDARVYCFLAKRGPQKAADIAKSLKMPKQTVYFVINGLQKEGVVASTVERPARFAAAPLEKVLDLFVKAKLEDARRVEQNRAEILSDWKLIAFPEADEVSPKFTVIQGRNTVYARIQHMIQETKKFLSITTSVSNLMRAEHFGLLDAVFQHPMRDSIRFRFLTELSDENVDTAKSLLKQIPRRRFNLEIRIPDLASSLLGRLVIRDGEEAVLFISSEPDSATVEPDDLCLGTNCKSIIKSLTAVFEDLWRDATGIHLKIAEIETGMQSPQTFVIKNMETARKKYSEALKSARKSIFALTSSAGLIERWTSEALVREWVNRGVSVRIMAPVTMESLEAARKLKKICEVKHVPMGYVETTIVDGQHLFQFKSPSLEKPESIPLFENTFYTNDSEHVKKTENMLSHIWESAQAPVAIGFKSLIQQSASTESPIVRLAEEYKKIIGFEWRREPQLGRITEKEVIERIRNAKRVSIKDARNSTLRVYATMGCAIVYPPSNIGLPNFLIQASHNHASSAFGPENFLVLFVQTNIAEQQSYLPVAFVTDNNRGYEYRKTMHLGQATTEVVHLVKKGELEVQLRGNKLFAGWTVPVPLLPPKHVLPPACVLFEGYGNVRTYSSEPKGHLNRPEVYEYNSLDAFVTFMNPASRYSGPASDGLLLREIIITSCPPHA